LSLRWSATYWHLAPRGYVEEAPLRSWRLRLTLSSYVGLQNTHQPDFRDLGIPRVNSVILSGCKEETYECRAETVPSF
jgi:hypothetical protein